MNENSLIKDIGRSYIISSMLPAGLFVTLEVFFYRNFVLSLFVDKNISGQLSVGLAILLLATLIMWIGFALFSIVNWTVRLYEGYYLPSWLSKLLVFIFYKGPHKKKTKYIQQIMQANQELPPDWKEKVDKYYNQAWSDYSDLELSSPIRQEHLLPSKLGNVLRASEQYPEKYGLIAGAGINIWPRLTVLLPLNMANQLEDKNNSILFLLNSSLLSYASGLIAVLFSVVFRIVHAYPRILIYIENQAVKDVFNNSTPATNEIKYLIFAGVWFLLGYALYIFSIPVAKTMGLLIRSSFDLYRFDLLKQLNYSLPETLSQEQSLWMKISDFIVTAGILGRRPLEFEYNLRSELLTGRQQTKYFTSRKSTKKK